MKKRGRLSCWLGFAAPALVLACATVLGLMYWQMRARAFTSRPLVLIHDPLNHERAQVGEGLTVHATARAARGVRRMELWVDDVLVAALEGAARGADSPLVLSEAWTPASLGRHAMVVRAVSADGVEGQASIVIEVVGGEGVSLGGHTAQEGETLASIAERYGVSPEDLNTLNPDIGPDGVAPGDVLTVPGGEESSEEPVGETAEEPEAQPTGDETAPNPDEEAPGGFLHLLWEAVPFIPEPETSAELVSLRLEALSLKSDSAYESLHCYVGNAGEAPRWYPDADGDQTTDESFADLGDQMWDVAGYLSGEAAAIITWPGNEPLSLDATCVGTLGGGTDAVPLGHLLLEIPPGEWDGVPRWSPTVSEEGSFALEYRVGPAMEAAVEGLDASMTPPTDLRLSSTMAFGNILYWSYEPRTGEESIEGFRVYLNGTLLWVEPADARTTTLPSQWMYPCVEPYTFTVTAFRGTYPDGPESTPSDPPVVIEAEPEHCDRVVYVTFLNLTTHDLGGDGNYRHLSGDVGPAYGYFYANDQVVGYDGRRTDPPRGLSHNSEYVIRDLWYFDGLSQMRVELAEGELLRVGYHNEDVDSGRCNDPSDAGCDDTICEGEAMLDVDVHTTSEERSIASRDGRCEVTYSLGIGAGFPAEAYGGELPLPWLTVDKVTMIEGSQLRIHVRNDGRANWESRDAKAAVVRLNGEPVDVLTWPAVSLRPGETRMLQSTSLDFGVLPVCVILDPDNEVAEYGDALESAGILQAHPRACMKLPDLVITDVQHDADAGQLLVSVQNQGEGDLEERSIGLSQHTLDGGPEAEPLVHGRQTLGPGESSVLTMAVDESLHSQWFRGYSVTVDPEGLIEESDEAHNTYTVEGGRQARLTLRGVQAPWQARNGVGWELRASAVSGGSRREIANWRIEGRGLDWSSCLHDVTHGECAVNYELPAPFDTDWFNIAGDDALEIDVTITNEHPVRDDFGNTFTWMATGATYGLEDEWGAGPPDARGMCILNSEGPGLHHWVLDSYSEWAPTLGYWHDWDWSVTFSICRSDLR